MKPYAYALCALLALQGAVLAADAPATAPAAAPAKSKAKMKTMSVSGTVVSTDAVGNTIVVKAKKGQETFSVPATAKIEEGKKTVALADIAADSKVDIRYTEENGQMEASMIKVHAASKSAKMKTKKAPADSAK